MCSVVRMTVQLSLVGIYLKYVFLFNNVLVNFLWVLVMILVANLLVPLNYAGN